jgi:2-C-methyl-D-erythritol 4-phosphate cytidylyltransferase
LSAAARFRCVALIACGGSGARFGAATPKQYLPLAGATVLHHTLAALTKVNAVEHVFVGAQADDMNAKDIASAFTKTSVLPTAGETRAATVLQTLEAIQPRLARDAWVLVHDAARPCVSADAIGKLIDELQTHAVGGLLAIPVTDTVKRANTNIDVAETLDRTQLWRAQTPQMFRYETLIHALRAAPDATDESQAIESLGLAPKLVMGEATNIKITFSEDLAWAERILATRV